MITVRDEQIEDAEALAQVAASATATLRQTYRPNELAFANKKRISRDSKRVVAIVDGQLVGTTQYFVDGDGIHIIGLGVLLAFRRQGVARALVAAVAESARALGLRALVCSTVKETGNVEIFELLGFRVVSEKMDVHSVSDTYATLTDVELRMDLEAEPAKMKYTVRRLNIGEADLYRSVRLESLRESPEAFSSTYESALSRTDDSWQAQADASASGSDRATFIVLADQPIGLAALYRDHDRPNEGELIQVWVSPEARGGNVAIDLMNAIFAWAASNGFETIRAEVTRNNLRALRFYEKCGFVRTENALGETTRILTKRVAQGRGANELQRSAKL